MTRSLLLIVVLIGMVVSCHDSSGGGDATAPLLVLGFPPTNAWTESAAITATGTASDPSGVAEVSVNGVIATTTDGFATWQASVPLVPGANMLTVAVRDALGNSEAVAAEAQVRSEALILNPGGITSHPTNQLVLVLDRALEAVVEVDLLTGTRAVLSDDSQGTGPGISNTFGMARDGNRALVVNRGNPPAVLAVDLSTGDRSILSDAAHGSGPLGSLLAIALDGDRALVTTDFAILAVDLASGDRTVVSDSITGSGPDFSSPEGIAVDGDRALVTDRVLNAVISVDLATGDRTILSDASTGTGPTLFVSTGIAVDGSRALVPGRDTASLEVGIYAIDLVTGDRTILSGASAGVGPGFSGPSAVLVDGANALVTDISGAVVSVDLVSGDRTILSPRASVGAGPILSGMGPRAVASDPSRVLVASDSTLYSVDPATGDRAILSESSTGGFHGIAIDGNRALVAATDAIFAVDLVTGASTILSSSLFGMGPDFSILAGIALDGTRALVVSNNGFFSTDIFAVDLASGDRTILSDSTEAGNSLKGIVVDGARALVTGSGGLGSAVLAVDLASGQRTIVSDDNNGSGPGFSAFMGSIALDGVRALVTDEFNGLFAVDLASGDRTLLSDRFDGAGPGNPSFSGITVHDGRVLVADFFQNALLAVDVRLGQRVFASR